MGLTGRMCLIPGMRRSDFFDFAFFNLTNDT